MIKSQKFKRVNLIKARKIKGITQEETAEWVGISRTTYSSIERGERNPRTETAIALSDLFGVDVKTLFKR
ncbi:XRE family transcriptional regulator [Salmonella enterica subsp. enterica]|nr:XRE family transcriptional regulator [Salmonella enterica subsp. enterica serovar Paratyphi A]